MFLNPSTVASSEKMTIASRIEYLDYLRFLAIMPVLLTHYKFLSMPGGYLGVNLFFCLSGYFIAILLMRDAKFVNGYAGFLVRRLFRILPMYYIALCFVLAIIWFKEGNLSKVNNISDAFIMLNVPVRQSFRMGFFWTLHVEFWFYVIFPILFLPCRSKLSRIMLCILVFSASLYLQWVPEAYGLVVKTFGFPPAINNLIIFSNNFIVGVFVAVILKDIKFDKIEPWHFMLGLVSLVSIIYLYAESGSPHDIGKYRYVYGSIVAVATGALIFLSRTPISLKFKLPGFAYIGLISYSLYLVHLPVLEIFSLSEASGRELNEILPGIAIVQKISFTQLFKFFAYCVILSTLTFYLIERPSMRLGRILGKKAESI